MIDNLRLVKTTADDLKISTTWVYRLISKGDIDNVIIDKVQFIVWNEKYFKYKKSRNPLISSESDINILKCRKVVGDAIRKQSENEEKILAQNLNKQKP